MNLTNSTDLLRIHSIESFGTHDGPGIRMVVFTQGCQFRCLYCANPDTWDVHGGSTMHITDIAKLARREKPYFGKRGGVTISGGEPTLQAKTLSNLFRLLKDLKIHVALDSNGRVLNDDVKELYELTDLLLLDVKHFNDDWHKKLTGLSNQSVLDIAAYRESTGRPMWLRYVLVPGWSDQQEYVEQLGQHFAEYKTIEKIEIQPYHRLGVHKWETMNMPYELEGVEPPNKDMIKRVADTFAKYFKEVKVN
ncbi:MAG TPA: pyruvate formate-lyase-activating protein [Phnomibacter sp.]|nr:pyruvate formate-lyase-activating protein [Phnomibacter sp.]